MLDVEYRDGVYLLTLNRPEVRNAFNDELIARLTQSIADLPDQARAVVLSGAGPAFCGGGDLNWMRAAADYSEAQNEADALRLARLFAAVDTCPVPVIARVNGPAFGGGLGLVAAADIAVAAEDARFAFSEVRLGLVPATISPFVVRKIGASHARALFTTGDAFDAAYALRIGLVHQVVSATNLEEAVAAKVAAIMSAGPLAVRNSKRLAASPPASLEDAAALLASARASEEGREGVAAFLEKRKPSFAKERR